MILAIVGSVLLDEGSQKELATEWIKLALVKISPTLVVSGGADGIDSLAEETAVESEYPFKKFLPKNRRWEPEGFKARNIQIAQTCDYLLCIRTKQSKTYGSGWTADYAQRIGKHVKRIII